MKGNNAFLDIFMYLFIGLAGVLILTHASGFASAVTSLGGVLTAESNILTGASTAK
jgi:hypothetical protein